MQHLWRKIHIKLLDFELFKLGSVEVYDVIAFIFVIEG